VKNDQTEKIEKAKTAMIHMIERIRTDEVLRYHIGYGTEDFDLLTEVAAELCEEPLDRVRAYASGFPPAGGSWVSGLGSRDPRAQSPEPRP
jgi:hypothetical protein